MMRKGETIYFKEVRWSGSGCQLGRSYELYRRVADETFRRISERDDTGRCTRDFGNCRLSIDLDSGDIYEHVGSVREEDWNIKQFNDTVLTGVNYEKLNVCLADEHWVNANAFDLVHILLKRKTGGD